MKLLILITSVAVACLAIGYYSAPKVTRTLVERVTVQATPLPAPTPIIIYRIVTPQPATPKYVSPLDRKHN